MNLKKLSNLIKSKIAEIDAVLILVLILVVIYLIINQFGISNSISDDQYETSSTLMELKQKVSDIETVLLATQEENTTLAEALEDAKRSSERLSEQFEDVVDDVEDFEKIVTTDPELLKKYSKIYFLNENYVPSDLRKIPDQFTYNPDRDYEVHDRVWSQLINLMEDADKDGMKLKVISAFRSFGEQSILKNSYKVIYGAGTANQFSADQGYSEHQLGTAVDFTTPPVGSSFRGFENTEEYKWLQDNAHKYGFVLSYPENNQYYQFEPWHWRYVGEKLADDLHDDGQNFYDLNQREIDEYIGDLF